MNPHAQALGSIKSEAKARASRKNGKLGGRPRKVFLCTKASPSRGTGAGSEGNFTKSVRNQRKAGKR